MSIVQTRATAILNWAVSMFGPVALNRDERAARVVEEAIELAQCEGVPKEVVERLVNVVYSKPVGDVRQEIAGLQLCLDALCANVGINSETECDVEFIRVSQWPKAYWDKKHAAKIANGVANLSPAQKRVADIQGHGKATKRITPIASREDE